MAKIIGNPIELNKSKKSANYFDKKKSQWVQLHVLSKNIYTN